MLSSLEFVEDKYEVLDKLGQGGMGAIFKVRHRLLNEVRIIKVMRPITAPGSSLQDRFLREARAATQLRHTNIAQVHDLLLAPDGTAYIVMEYIVGLDLKQLLREYSLPPVALVLELAVQTLTALGYLHRQGFVHRDISPDNLMLTHDEEGQPRVKLIDLGLAKSLQDEGSLTDTGAFLGKVRYASPEHFGDGSGEACIEARSDLYSLGVVLYELLTGRLPVSGSDYNSLIAGHVLRPPLDFAESDPQGRVPERLRQIVMRTLEKAPEDRFVSAEELVRQLLEARQELLAGTDAAAADPWLSAVRTRITEVSSRPPGVGTAIPRARSSSVGSPAATSSSSSDSVNPTMSMRRSVLKQATLQGSWVRRWTRKRITVPAVVLLLAGLLALPLLLLRDGSRAVPAMPAAPTGTLLLDAEPWAEVVAVISSDNRSFPRPDPPFTPASMELPAGEYTIVLRHPAATVTATVQVTGNQVVRHREQMRAVDVDRFLREYGW